MLEDKKKLEKLSIDINNLAIELSNIKIDKKHYKYSISELNILYNACNYIRELIK